LQVHVIYCILRVFRLIFVFSEKDFSVEIWYDETPLLEQVKIEIIGGKKYDQKNFIERWLSKTSQWLDLIRKKFIEPFAIRNTVRQAQDISCQYADKHNFFTINEEGKKNRFLDDNEVDACRHFCWNVILVRKFGVENATIITSHHEVFWKELRNKEDFTRANIMDLWNNFQGREYAKNYPDKEPLELFYMAKENEDLITDLQGVTPEKKEIILELIQEFL